MLQAMYAGVSGLTTHQTSLDIIGNNIANVNTPGYKATRATFQQQLSQVLSAATAPTQGGTGGTNPAEVGLGVTLGSVDTIQTQGNMQSTGKNTDLALQGGGYFMVSAGNGVYYTRAGSFDLIGGTLVNTATGQHLLGYPADSFGNVDTSAPVTAKSTITVPIGMLTDAKQTSHIGFTGNLDASASLYSTKIDLTGNLDSTGANVPAKVTSTVYDSLGNAHKVEISFSNPQTGAGRDATGVSLSASQQWDVTIKVDNGTVYAPSSKSRLYMTSSGLQFASGGAAVGSSIVFNGGAAANDAAQITGTNGAPNFSIDLNFGSMTNTAGAGTAPTAAADGQSGSSPTWGASAKIYDSLGVEHMVTVKYTHVQPASTDPAGTTSRWDWTAIDENGNVVGSSSSPGNTPLCFGSTGRLVAGTSQTVTINTGSGAVSPFTATLDNTSLTQLASESNATSNSQDGYPVGTLESFTVSADGVVTGIFSSGQNRALGQIALASFLNPGGLSAVGGNMYNTSADSGEPQIGVPGTSGRGKINTGYLEMSNVDLSSQFTNLIIVQRGFQANTKIVTAVDELLQDVINLKR